MTKTVLCNNAFYIVNVKKEQSGEGGRPVVSVIARKENDKVVIALYDNGNGFLKKYWIKYIDP